MQRKNTQHSLRNGPTWSVLRISHSDKLPAPLDSCTQTRGRNCISHDTRAQKQEGRKGGGCKSMQPPCPAPCSCARHGRRGPSAHMLLSCVSAAQQQTLPAHLCDPHTPHGVAHTLNQQSITAQCCQPGCNPGLLLGVLMVAPSGAAVPSAVGAHLHPVWSAVSPTPCTHGDTAQPIPHSSCSVVQNPLEKVITCHSARRPPLSPTG